MHGKGNAYAGKQNVHLQLQAKRKFTFNTKPNQNEMNMQFILMLPLLLPLLLYLVLHLFLQYFATTIFTSAAAEAAEAAAPAAASEFKTYLMNCKSKKPIQ